MITQERTESDWANCVFGPYHLVRRGTSAPRYVAPENNRYLAQRAVDLENCRRLVQRIIGVVDNHNGDFKHRQREPVI